MNPYVLPFIAGPVALVSSVTRVLVPILLTLPIEAPPSETLSLYIAGSRFSVFVLVYGLLFGLAYWAGSRYDTTIDGPVTLATGVVAAISYFVGSLVVFQFIGPGEHGWLLTIVQITGSSVGVGVQLAVVAFAGIAAANRNSMPAGKAIDRSQ